jgi:NAD(P)-dependent dehydrogenase (short-subunit alcohol dehydrogenase family)
MSEPSFAGKTVVITGGASGIGRACALAFARAGASVVIADVNRGRLAEVEVELTALGAPALGVVCDVSRDADVEALAAAATARFGPVDILMNNAGVMLRGPLEKMPISEWEWILGINFLGPVRGLRAFLPAMIARGSGHIVNTASIGGLVGGRPHSAGYSASKFALMGLSETLYVYLKPKGIGVSVLCPGGVRTNLTEQIKVSQTAVDTDDLGLDEVFGPDAADPDQVAQLVLSAVAGGQFLILTDPRHQKLLEHRVANLQSFVEGRARTPNQRS